MNCSVNAISELSIILWRHKLNSNLHGKALKTISGTLFLFKIKNKFIFLQRETGKEKMIWHEIHSPFCYLNHCHKFKFLNSETTDTICVLFIYIVWQVPHVHLF